MNIEQFDSKYYKFDVVLIDAAGKYTPLNGSSIQNLTIVDSVLSTFTVGSIILCNTKNTLQSSPVEGQSLTLVGNNRDTLVVNIMPNITGNLQQDAENEELKKIFNLQYMFAVNELQNGDEKIFKDSNTMSLRDIYHQFMLESSCEVSSADIARRNDPGTNPRDMNNSDRSAKTGELLKEIIKKTFSVTGNSESIIDESNFDLGKVSVLWESMGSSNSLQSMMHISSMHLSEDKGDPAVLSIDRYTRKFSNIALSKIFELQKSNPKEWVMETFLIDSGIGGGPNKSNNRGQGLQNASYIIDYRLSPVNGNEFTRSITNSIYTTYASADKNSYIGTSQGALKEVYKTYSKLYVEPFSFLSPNIVPSAQLDEFVKTKNLSPRFYNEITPISHEPSVSNNMIWDLIIGGGDCIVFRTTGSTHRMSGKFIDIATETELTDNSFAGTILGRWFVVSVSHVFINNKYYNVIEAVKTYSAA